MNSPSLPLRVTSFIDGHYSRVPNNREANLILFEKKIPPTRFFTYTNEKKVPTTCFFNSINKKYVPTTRFFRLQAYSVP